MDTFKCGRGRFCFFVVGIKGSRDNYVEDFVFCFFIVVGTRVVIFIFGFFFRMGIY